MPSIPQSLVAIVQAPLNVCAREWYRFFLDLLGFSASATLDFPNTAAGACSDLTVDVPGAADGDVVSLGVPTGSVPANGSFFAWVSAPGVVTIRYTNNSLATAYNPASGTFWVVTRRFQT